MKVLVTAIAFIALAVTAFALPARGYPVLQANRPPKVDGILTDTCWEDAPWTTGFTGLGAGVVAAQTRFAMAWDAKDLYLAVRCREPAIDKIVAAVTARDGRIWKDDSIELFATGIAARTPYFHFAANSKGARFDERIQSATWNAPWRAAGRVGKGEWTLELAIPLSAVGVKAQTGATFWGNIGRSRYAGGGEEYSTWTPLTGGFHEPSNFAVFRLVGADKSGALAIAHAMDRPFRAALEEQMRAAVTLLERAAKGLPLARKFPSLSGKAAAAERDLALIRRSVATGNLFDAAMQGGLVKARQLAARLRELDYQARIEQMLAGP